MLAGYFTDRITVQTRTVTEGALGPEDAWADGDTLYCRVAVVGLESRARYGQVLNGEVTHRVIIPGKAVLSLQQRFVWGTNGNAVLIPVEPAGTFDGRYTTIMVREEQGDG
jgi:head-tail adaptor